MRAERMASQARVLGAFLFAEYTQECCWIVGEKKSSLEMLFNLYTTLAMDKAWRDFSLPFMAPPFPGARVTLSTFHT